VLVDVALLGAAVWTLAVDLVPTSVLERDPDKFGTTVLSSPLVGPYATADARWIVLNMLDPDRHWAPACRALGLAHLIDHPDYATTALRAETMVALREIFVETIGKQTLADLKAALSEHDTIFSALASPTEVLADPQVEANSYMPRHPEHERARVSAGPVQFDMETTVVRRRAPQVGEHTDEVLTELGFTAAEIGALRDSGAIA
jgi:crotonobetainyl-CoA:carnitine CoA-transferase CaiB-like acyl-CoA transferase